MFPFQQFSSPFLGSNIGGFWPACGALLPLFNIYNFMTCPIERLTQEGKGLSAKKLLGIPLFWGFLLLMIGAGASEASMAQWASAYVESALGFSKTIGDIVGPCMFAVSMGLSRTVYGKYGHKMNLVNFMMGVRHSVPGMLFAGRRFRQPCFGADRLYCLRIFCRHHVARFH